MECHEDSFPVGLRVLVVDDDPICLLILERLLRSLFYQVTTCGEAVIALSMLRENRSRFDLVISDVHMPDMDGFKLLELVGLEMDVPVIMMSANGETSNVMKGITQGACDYLLKPVRLEELQNIWQHVVRKKQKRSKESEPAGNLKDCQRPRQTNEDGETAVLPIDDTDGFCSSLKKRKESKDDDSDNEEGDNLGTVKRQRVVWSVELHQKFVSAVNQLGLEQAVPKRILDLMNVHGLTRENVASHLQKFRLYLKRMSGTINQQVGMVSYAGASGNSINSLVWMNGLSDSQALLSTGQLSPQVLETSQPGIGGRIDAFDGGGMSSRDSSTIFQLAAEQCMEYGDLGRSQFCHPSLQSQGSVQPGGADTMKISQPNFLQPFGQSETLLNDSSELLVLQQCPKGLRGAVPGGGINCSELENSGNNSLTMHLLQNQQLQSQQCKSFLNPSLHGLIGHPNPFNGIITGWVQSPTVSGMHTGPGNGVLLPGLRSSSENLDFFPSLAAHRAYKSTSNSIPSCLGVSVPRLPTPGSRTLSCTVPSLLESTSSFSPVSIASNANDDEETETMNGLRLSSRGMDNANQVLSPPWRDGWSSQTSDPRETESPGLILNSQAMAGRWNLHAGFMQEPFEGFPSHRQLSSLNSPVDLGWPHASNGRADQSPAESAVKTKKHQDSN